MAGEAGWAVLATARRLLGRFVNLAEHPATSQQVLAGTQVPGVGGRVEGAGEGLRSQGRVEGAGEGLRSQQEWGGVERGGGGGRGTEIPAGVGWGGVRGTEIPAGVGLSLIHI